MYLRSRIWCSFIACAWTSQSASSRNTQLMHEEDRPGIVGHWHRVRIASDGMCESLAGGGMRLYYKKKRGMMIIHMRRWVCIGQGDQDLRR